MKVEPAVCAISRKSVSLKQLRRLGTPKIIGRLGFLSKVERIAPARVEFLSMTIPAPGLTAPPAAEKILKLLLQATQEGNYEAFIALGTERFQQGISKSMFFGVSEQVASRLQAGHATEFLTEINQCEHSVYLWKLSFSDGGNQFIARLALMTDDKVAGFMLN